MKTLHLRISGMHCQRCVETIRDALTAEANISRSDVRLNEADVTFDSNRFEVGDVLTLIRNAGTFEITGFCTSGE